jgi:hypothetical protein
MMEVTEASKVGLKSDTSEFTEKILAVPSLGAIEPAKEAEF